MSSKHERLGRHPPPTPAAEGAGVVAIRTDVGNPWRHWQDVPVVRALQANSGTSIEQFIITCLRRGYLIPEMEPATKPFIGFEVRLGEMYFKSTERIQELYWVGAQSDGAHLN